MAKKHVKYSVVLSLCVYIYIYICITYSIIHTELDMKQVDAFTDSPFKGNPAAVCLLEEDRDEKWLQLVAAEFNISETCYLTRITESESHHSPNDPSIPKFRLRWFTPVAEVFIHFPLNRKVCFLRTYLIIFKQIQKRTQICFWGFGEIC